MTKQRDNEDKIKYEEELPDVEVELVDQKNEEKEIEKVKGSNETPANIPRKLEKVEDEKIRGRIVIFNAEKSEFAKSLKLSKPGDYIEKK